MIRCLLVPLLIGLSLSTLADRPTRIVSTSGNASHTVYQLGLVDRLVAVDTTSLLPPKVMAKKPKIGYRRQLSAEGILSMAPDIVILAPDAGPPAIVKQLQGAGLNLFYLTDRQTLDGINEDIGRLGAALGVPKAAQRLIEKQKQQAKALGRVKSRYQRKPKLVILMDTGTAKLFALGADTSGEHMIEVLGGELSVPIDGMKPISNEILLADESDAVLVALRGDGEKDSVIRPLEKGRYNVLDRHQGAAKGCVFEVNIMKTLGFGPGTADVARQIAERILPCINNRF